MVRAENKAIRDFRRSICGRAGRWLQAQPRPAAGRDAEGLLGNDADNRAAVAAVARDDLDLVGLAFRAERKIADKIIKSLRLHP
nr:DUF2000 family protein [Mesorhizobium albiziae]